MYVYFKKTMNSLDFLQSHLLKLKKISYNEYSSLCPFHHEKNPSFGVNFSKNTYHCFSCDQKGTINSLIKFFGGNDENVDLFVQKYDITSTTFGSDYSKNDYKVVDNTEYFKTLLNHLLVNKAILPYDISLIQENTPSSYLINKNIDLKTINNFYISQKKSRLRIKGVAFYVKKNDLIFASSKFFQVFTTHDKDSTDDADKWGKPFKKFIKGSKIVNQSVFFQSKSKYFIYCEGLSTALSLNMAGYNAIACLNKSNLKNIVQKQPEIDNLIVSIDSDDNSAALISDLKKVGISKFLTFKKEKKGFDANDYHQVYGLDKLKKKINRCCQERIIKKEKLNPETSYIKNLVFDTRVTGQGKTLLIVQKIAWQIKNYYRSAIVIVGTKDQMANYFNYLKGQGIPEESIIRISGKHKNKDVFKTFIKGAVYLIMSNYFEIFLKFDRNKDILPAFKKQKHLGYNEILYDFILDNSDYLTLYLDEFHELTNSIFKAIRNIDYFFDSNDRLFGLREREHQQYFNILTSPFAPIVQQSRGSGFLEFNSSAITSSFFDVEKVKAICDLSDFEVETSVNKFLKAPIFISKLRLKEDVGFSEEENLKISSLLGEEFYLVRKFANKSILSEEEKEEDDDSDSLKLTKEKVETCFFIFQNKALISLINKLPYIHISTATSSLDVTNLAKKLICDRDCFYLESDIQENIDMFKNITFVALDNKNSSIYSQKWAEIINILGANTNTNILYVLGSKKTFESKLKENKSFAQDLDSTKIFTIHNKFDKFGYFDAEDNSKKNIAITYSANPVLTGSNMFFGTQILALSLTKDFYYHIERFNFEMIKLYFEEENYQEMLLENTLNQIVGRLVRQPPDKVLQKFVFLPVQPNTMTVLRRFESEKKCKMILHNIQNIKSLISEKILPITNKNTKKYPLKDLGKYKEELKGIAK